MVIVSVVGRIDPFDLLYSLLLLIICFSSDFLCFFFGWKMF